MTNLQRWRLYTKDLESPDCFIDWTYYSMISACLQRRVWFYEDSYSLYCNLFNILVGPPATGKSRIIAVEKDFLSDNRLTFKGAAGKVMQMYPVAPDAMTWQRLPDVLYENMRGARCIHNGQILPYKIKYTTESGEVGLKEYMHASLAFVSEELSVLINEENAQVVSVLNQLYDARSLHYSTRSKAAEIGGENERVDNVCTTLMAGSYPEFFNSKVMNAIVLKGFGSRVIFVYAGGPRFCRQFPGISEEQKAAKETLIRHLKALFYVNGEVKLSPEASAYHKEFYESGKLRNNRINRDRRLDYYYGRKNVHWLKLAACMHYGEESESMEIGLATLKSAYKVLTQIEPNMHFTFQSSNRNPTFDAAMHIQSLLRSNTQGLSWKKLWWNCGRNSNRAELQEAIDFLEDTGRISRSGGAGGYVYTLTPEALEDTEEEPNVPVQDTDEKPLESSEPQNVVALNNLKSSVG